jgi:hypothetical protein
MPLAFEQWMEQRHPGIKLTLQQREFAARWQNGENPIWVGPHRAEKTMLLAWLLEYRKESDED